MANPTRVLVFAGSARKDSFNKKLARLAAEAVGKAGAQATFVDLRDYPLPLFDGDLEDSDGMPANGKALKKLFIEHDALFISSPEYNSSITPLLKNTLDWVSRVETDDEKPLLAYAGKVAALVSASPGALGGMRALVAVRAMLGNISVLLVPEQLCVTKAHEAFTESGALKEPKQQAALERIAAALVKTTTRLKG